MQGQKKKPQQRQLLTALASVWTITGDLEHRGETWLTLESEPILCIAMIADSPTPCKGKNIDRLLFTDGLRDEVQLRGEAVLSAGRSI